MDSATMKVETSDSIWDALADSEQEAATLKARSAVLYEIRRVVKSWALSRDASAARLGLNVARFDDLLKGRLTDFSLDMLVQISAAAHLSIEIKVNETEQKGAASPQPASRRFI